MACAFLPSNSRVSHQTVPYEKAPTADLEEEKPDLPDEVALGVTYKEIDDYLEGKEVSDKAADQIEKLWNKSKHKRHLPVTVFDDFYKK